MTDLHLAFACCGVVCWTIFAGAFFQSQARPRWLGLVLFVGCASVAVFCLFLLVRPIIPGVTP